MLLSPINAFTHFPDAPILALVLKMRTLGGFQWRKGDIELKLNEERVFVLCWVELRAVSGN